MTLTQFRALDELEQADIVGTGAHVGTRAEGELTVLLYRIDTFYVEVFYNRGSRRVVKYRPFDDPALLQPYLGQ